MESSPMENVGRSKRQSTMICTAATQSVLNQSWSTSPKRTSSFFAKDTPSSPKENRKKIDKGRRGGEVTVVPETPDEDEQSLKSLKSRRKSMAAMERFLEEDAAEEDRLAEEEERLAQEKQKGEKDKPFSRMRTPKVDLPKFSKQRRRSNITMEMFHSVRDGHANSPLRDLDLEEESSSEDDDDDSIGESMKKYLPKPVNSRKSVFISGNLKSKTKKLLAHGGGTKSNTKSRKNLNPQLERLSKEAPSMEEQNVTSSPLPAPRRSSSRPATKAAGQTLQTSVLQAITASRLSSGGRSSHDNSNNSGNTGNTPSYQNFSSDSAKEIIAKLQEGGGSSRKRKADEEQNCGESKKRKEEPSEVKRTPRKTEKGDPVTPRMGGAEKMEIAASVMKPPPPAIKKLTSLKMGEKTSLTPQAMDLCSPETVRRRSGRDSTRMATKATDSFVQGGTPPAPTTAAGPSPPPPPPAPAAHHSRVRELDISLATQPPPLLDGLVICVDYRNEARSENLGGSIKSIAVNLGATIVERVHKGVTHLIFRNGHEGNFSKARKLGIPIVSVGWLEESRKAGKQLPVGDWPSLSLQRYSSPHLYPKLKKLRSMQPKSLEEDMAKVEKNIYRKTKMMEKKEAEEKARKERLEGSRSKDPLILETSRVRRKPHFLDDFLEEIQGLPEDEGGTKDGGTGTSDEDYDTPLAMRLLKNRMKGRDGSPQSNAKAGPNSPLTSSNLDTTSKPRREAQTPAKVTNPGSSLSKTPTPNKNPEPPSPSPSRRSARASTQICTQATQQVAIQEASPPVFELPPSPVLKKVRTKNPLGHPVMESTRRSTVKSPVKGSKNGPLGRPVMESTRISPNKPKGPQVSPLVQKIQNDILFDSLLKSPSKQCVAISPTPLVSPPTKPSSIVPLPSTLPPEPPSSKTGADQKSRVLPSVSNPAKVPSSGADVERRMVAIVSPTKSPRLVAPWRHQGKPQEPADYEDVYEFSSFPDEPITSSSG